MFYDALARCARKYDLFDRIITNRAGYQQDAALLYSDLIASHADGKEQFEEWCKRSIYSFDKDKWLEELKSGGESLKLLIDFRHRDPSLTLGLPFRDAFEDFIINVARSDITIEPLVKSNWDTLLTLMDHQMRCDLTESVIKRVEGIEEEAQIADELFGLFGSEMKFRGADNDTRHRLSRLALRVAKDPREFGMTWLRGEVEELQSDHDDILSHDVSFTERVEANLSKDKLEGTVRDSLIRMADVIGIKAPSDKQSDEASNSPEVDPPSPSPIESGSG
jgi:hypothetical protein